ncbi:MAG: energy transducer TonB [Leptolyngbya sp. LCM1.Bin17]|nr:MAG: energy transducer TonB [Leptolyngbya sp. LCM1.Bin17]
MHISFLTTVSQYRDPKLLWPLAAIASLLVHGTALALLRPVLETRSAVDELATSSPIQLLTLAPDSEPAAYSGEVDPVPSVPAPRDTPGTESAPAVTPPPESAADPAPPNPVDPPPEVASPPSIAPSPPASSSPAAPTPAPVAPPPATPAPEVAPRPPVASPPPVSSPPRTPAPVAPAPEPSPAPSTGVASEAPAPRPPVDSPPSVSSPPVSSPPTTPSPTPPQPSAPGGGASETGGQLQALRIVQEQQARDIPDSPPRLTGTTRISLDPLPAACQAAGGSSALTSGQVNLRIRVEASGEISYTTVVQSSGNPALDDLVSCVVRQALQVQPASVDGTPLPSTDYVLETRVQMPF